ncbi:MAG: AMP-binding protein, partial [Xanthomonadales bacterium]|nr:AMP-binding protein [Gammaproteobacteria bacterium]NNK05050.1 AMP-binding protein [Xanthomonadales bacterium]
MLGLMQNYPLLAHTILDHAALNHGDREMVTRAIEGPIRRINYHDLRLRALQVAKALHNEGISTGDRVATMAWNTDRHFETWYGVMGIGAICHTLNPRLFAEQLVYIINHAEDKILFIDLTFVPLAEELAAKLPSIKKYI